MANEWKIRVHGVEKLTVDMEAAARAGMRNGLEKIGLRGQAMVQHNIASPFGAKPPAVAFGVLAGGIFSELSPEELRLVIGVSPPADVYGLPVETGTRPHLPPPSALVPWVKQKGLASDEKKALSIAFAISKTIAKRGTRGHLMFERAFENLEGEVNPIMERELAVALQQAGFEG